jgi:phage baseplate assembly protein W
VITITNLSNKIKSENSYIFSDLHLDLVTKKKSVDNISSNIVDGNDIVIDTDKQAIFNSITNLFIQNRYLNQDFALNLAEKYLGTPISQAMGHTIGNDIDRMITNYEPRVKVNKITVVANPSSNSYFIIINVILINFNNTQLTISGVLTNTGNFISVNSQ